jgi:hypothetical protein
MERFNKQSHRFAGAFRRNRFLPELKPDTNPLSMDPDALRASIRDALRGLPQEQAAPWRDTILDGLANAGLDLDLSLFLSGIIVGRRDELSASDLGHLVRYVRLNRPGVIRAVANELTGLVESLGSRQSSQVPARRKAA